MTSSSWRSSNARVLLRRTGRARPCTDGRVFESHALVDVPYCTGRSRTARGIRAYSPDSSAIQIYRFSLITIVSFAFFIPLTPSRSLPHPLILSLSLSVSFPLISYLSLRPFPFPATDKYNCTFAPVHFTRSVYETRPSGKTTVVGLTGLKRKLPCWPYGFALAYRARRLPVPLDQRVWVNTQTVRSPNVPETRRHNGTNKPGLSHIRT